MRTRNVVSVVLVLAAGARLNAQSAPRFRDSPLPDITVPQTQAQVVSPAIYSQLGSQDRELQNIDRQLVEMNISISSIRTDIKPLQETDVRIRFLFAIAGWILGIVLTSGLGGWFFHWLQRRKRHVKTGSLGL